MPAPINIFRGDSPAVAKVQTWTFQSILAGLTFTFTCGNKVVSYTTTASDTGATVATAIAAAISAAAATMPEFADIAAGSSGAVLTCTAATPGVPFTLVCNFPTATPSGIVTIAETAPGKVPINEVHQVSLVGTYTGGTFTLTYSFGTTSALAYNASAATVQSALAALVGVGAGNVLVTGGPGPGTPWIVTWTGSLAGTAVAAGSVNGTSLTGSATVVISEVTKGNGLSDEIQAFAVQEYTAGTYTLTLDGQTTTGLAPSATPAAVQSALQALPNIGAGNVTVYGVGGGGGQFNKNYYWIVFGGVLAQTSQNLISINTGNLAGGPTGLGFCTRYQRGGQTVSDDFQVVDLGGATAGTYSINYGGNVSSAISVLAPNAAGALQAAIAAAAGITTADVAVFDVGIGFYGEISGLPVTNFLVHFTGAHANTAMKLLSVNGGGLTGSSGQTVTRASNGQGNVNEQWSIYTTGTGGTFTLTLNSQTTAATAYNASTATIATNIQSAFTNSLTTVSVTGSGTPSAPWIVTVTAPADTQLGPPTGSGSLLTGGGGNIAELTHAVAGANEVQTVTLSTTLGGAPTGGTFTLAFQGQTTAGIAYNASAATVQTALTGLSTINTATVAGSAGGPYTVTWSGAEGDAPQPLLVGNGTSLTGSGAQTVTQLTTTLSSGPHHFDDPLNWTQNRLPNSGDALLFEAGASDCLYGLHQIDTFSWTSGTTLQLGSQPYQLRNGQSVYLTSTNTLPTGLSANTLYYIVNLNVDAGTFSLSLTLGGGAITVSGAGSGTHTIGVRLASIEQNTRWTGGMGLPEQNANGYYEYRPRYLHIGLATTAQGGSTCVQTVTIGTEAGTGSSRINLDTDVDQAFVTVQQTGGQVETGVPACLWRGTNAASTFTLIDGSAGLGVFPGETVAVAAITQRGGNLEIGPLVTLTGPLVKTGGTLAIDGATINGTVLAL